MGTSIALVGRPNVGKSRLFNRIIGRRCSIVHDQPGVTRDVIAEDIDGGITIMDTGGIGLSSSQEKTDITIAVENQISFAISAADIIFFVVDARAGCTPLDYEIASNLRKSNKKIFLLANKIDFESELYRGDAFHVLGLGNPIAISAEHGFGESDLEEIISQYKLPYIEKTDKNIIKFCLAGRPNVGKSSIANAILNENRLIESPIAGTTRDAVSCEIDYNYDGREYCFQFIDTAGLRAKKKISSSVEYFSSLRTVDAISSVDIVFFIIDALTGITREDKTRIGQILKQEKCIVLVVNKWDLACDAVKNELVVGYNSVEDFQEKFIKAIQKEFSRSTKFPIIFVSAKTNFNINKILSEGVELYNRASQNIPTGPLNRTIHNLLERQPPVFVTGKRFKIYYSVQSGNFPIRFKIFCNRYRRLTDAYKRYLENGIRNVFDLTGCQIKFEFVEKEMRYSEKQP